jgi:uncharacterized membrane protein
MSNRKNHNAQLKSQTQKDNSVEKEILETYEIQKNYQFLSIDVSIWICFAIYFCYVLWGVFMNGTWDDDCQSRYFNTVDALKNPHQFIDLWNRPLFIILFFIPVLMGKISIPIFMSLISVTGGYYLYKALKHLKVPNTLLILFLLLLQPYYMGVGRDAMTEPLASAIVCIGFYLMVKQKWTAFALLGSLLPLARTEMTALLPLWAMILFQHKEWKKIPLLAFGLLLWQVMGVLITNDPLFLYTQTIKKESIENIYGHKKFNTYFIRYLYIIGPVVFYYFFLGIISRLKALKIDWFIIGQFVIGFLMYTMLAHKFNLGQSAGFLRNLIPLSPLAAILALYGYNWWIDSLTTKKDILFIILSSIGCLILTYLYYRNRIDSHHTVTQEFDKFNLPIVISLVFLTTLLTFLKVEHLKKMKVGLATAIALAITSHTFYTEPPSKNINQERSMLNRLVEDYKKLDYKNAPQTYVASQWFFWSSDIKRDQKKYSYMKKEYIANAVEGSIVIWEFHFSNRLGYTVELSQLQNDTNYIEIGKYYGEQLKQNAFLFYRKPANMTKLQAYNSIINKAENSADFFASRSSYYKSIGMQKEALQDMEKAYGLSKGKVAFIKYSYAETLSFYGNTEQALKIAEELIKSDKEVVGFQNLKGNIFLNNKEFEKALSAYMDASKIDKEDGSPYFNIGITYLNLNKIEEACGYFTIAKLKKINQANSMIQQFCNKTPAKIQPNLVK